MLRVSDGKPPCVPFIKVAWHKIGTAHLFTSHWMPLWCFHPLVVDSYSTTTPPIHGNHIAVMTWLIDVVTRTCADCSSTENGRCALHSLPPAAGGVAELNARGGRYNFLRGSAVIDGISYLTPTNIGSGSADSPGGFLVLALSSTPTQLRASTLPGPRHFFGAVVLTKKTRSCRKITFGHAAAQRFLRTVFDTLAVRDISEAEALDAFSYDAAEQLLPLNRAGRQTVHPGGIRKQPAVKRARAGVASSDSKSGGDSAAESAGADGTEEEGEEEDEDEDAEDENEKHGRGGRDGGAEDHRNIAAGVSGRPSLEVSAASRPVAMGESQRLRTEATAATTRALEASEKQTAELAARVFLLEQREATTLWLCNSGRKPLTSGRLRRYSGGQRLTAASPSCMICW